ncbi:MAG: hypothetical protein LBU27_09155 [Candidatus Peribacteria bacterium]|nr:hypothetical protein [Candidatus Peribacteria bacterium]
MTDKKNTPLEGEKQNTVPSTKNVEKVVLKNDTIIADTFYKKGSEIEATDEIKKILKPFGYTFNS